MSTQHKNRHFCSFFRWSLAPFHYPPSYPAFSLNLSLLGKQEALGLSCGEHLHGQGKSYLPLQHGCMDGCIEVSLARRFRTLEGISRRVPGVWILSCPTYFNCCPFPLKTPNCRPPSGDHIILMSINRNALVVTIWTRSSFAGVGDFTLFVHISAVNCRCWFPATMFLVCWNSSNQYLILLAFFLLLKTNRPSSL